MLLFSAALPLISTASQNTSYAGGSGTGRVPICR